MKHKLLILIFSLLLIVGCKKNEVETTSMPEFYNGTFEVKINDSLITPTWGTVSNEFGLFPNINGTDSAGFDFGSSYYGFKQKYGISIHFFSHLPNNSLIHTSNGQELSNTSFSQLFNMGSHSFTYLAFLNGGVIVTWYDDKGVRWSSGKYKVTDTIPLTHPNYSLNNFVINYSNSESNQVNYKQRVQASFNCWVYNASGDSLLLEDAKFNGIFEY